MCVSKKNGAVLAYMRTVIKCHTDLIIVSGFTIPQVRKARKENSYVKSTYESLEDCSLLQAQSWISIGLRCAEKLPEKRPTIEQIMHFIKTESANATVCLLLDLQCKLSSILYLHNLQSEYKPSSAGVPFVLEINLYSN